MKCKVCGKNEVISLEMCNKHYQQYRRYGKIMDNNPRTVNDDNEIRIYDTYVEIDTYDKFGNVNYTYKLDLEDVKYLTGNKWRTSLKGRKTKSPYLVTGKVIYFHRLVMGCINKEIDHINRDTTDNRKSNLRESFRIQQSLNTRVRLDNIQGIKGVYYSKRDNIYRAEIQIFNKKYYSKSFKTKQEAVYMRYLFENKFFTLLNIPVCDIKDYLPLLTEQQKHNIDKYFKFKSKDWVVNV